MSGVWLWFILVLYKAPARVSARAAVSSEARMWKGFLLRSRNCWQNSVSGGLSVACSLSAGDCLPLALSTGSPPLGSLLQLSHRES